MSLAGYEDRLYYIPGCSDRYIATVKLGSSYMNMFDENVWNINSIFIKGKEIQDSIPFNREFDSVELRSYILQAIAIPSLYLQIRYSENINKDDLFINSHSSITNIS